MAPGAEGGGFPPMITPVILSGGAGSRLWPLSRSALPKQFLPLAGPGSMIQDTLTRTGGEGFSPPTVIASSQHRFLVAEQLRAAGISKSRIILEPVGRNTAPAAAIAALLQAEIDPDGLMLLLPSDHVVRDRAAFLDAVRMGALAARNGRLVTFGIPPAAPETGYGYIKAAAALAGLPGVRAVGRFVEKPDRLTAQAYIDSGDYYWNSGMFLWRAGSFLDELARHEPEILDACRATLGLSRRDDDFIRLDETAFAACPSQSVDYGVMERATNVAVVPADIGWNDVGSWQALWEISQQNAEGNALLGDVLAEGVRNSYIRSEGPLVAAVGISDLAVIATKDAVLVSHRGAVQDVRKIVDELARHGRQHHLSHPVVARPWGSYETIDSGAGFQVKHIMVHPGAKLSLQMHHKRAEHWVVVDGTALVTCGEDVFTLGAGGVTYIPLGATHRLENAGSVPLHLIEVQCGAYLGEDDIVRFDDVYGRVS